VLDKRRILRRLPRLKTKIKENKMKAAFKAGDHVTYAGYEFTVVEICSWDADMIVVRNSRGSTCVTASACKAIK
jgi:hypothetical protein